MPKSDDTATPFAVSLTPVAADRDARALKVAASLARLGYISRLYEGAPSKARQLDYPAAIDSLVTRAPNRSTNRASAARPPAVVRQRHATWMSLAERILAPLKFAKFRVEFHRRFAIDANCLDRAALCYMHSYEYFSALQHPAELKCPLIYDAHDFYQGLIPDEGGSLLQRQWIMPFLARLEARCITRASHVVTVCDGIANELEARHGVRPVVLRNVHDPRLELEPSQGIRERLRVKPDALLVVVVGNNKVGLAFDEVVRAVSDAPVEIALAFVGKGYDISPYANRLRLRMHAVDDIQAREVVPFIRGADLAIVPYKPVSKNGRYALPNGLFQALGAGLPTIFPDLPEIVRLLQPFAVGPCVSMSDVGQLASALVHLVQPTQLASARAEARRFTAANNWTHEEAVLSRIVEEAAEKRHAFAE